MTRFLVILFSYPRGGLHLVIPLSGAMQGTHVYPSCVPAHFYSVNYGTWWYAQISGHTFDLFLVPRGPPFFSMGLRGSAGRCCDLAKTTCKSKPKHDVPNIGHQHVFKNNRKTQLPAPYHQMSKRKPQF